MRSFRLAVEESLGSGSRRMKAFIACALALVILAAGVLMGMQLNRYEYVKLAEHPARFDRLNGTVEVIEIEFTDGSRKQIATTAEK